MTDDIKALALLRDRLRSNILSAFAVQPFDFELVTEDIVRGGNYHTRSFESGRYYVVYYETYYNGTITESYTQRPSGDSYVYSCTGRTFSGTKSYEELDFFYNGKYKPPQLISGAGQYVRAAALPENITITTDAPLTVEEKVRAALEALSTYNGIEIHPPDDFGPDDFVRVRVCEVKPIWKKII